MEEIFEKNRKAEQLLNTLFLKHCAKQCPNLKCGQYFQLMRDSECTHMQCPRCFTWFCWVCCNPAKGQKHFKENPSCKNFGPPQPDEITKELKDKFVGVGSDFVNLKFCARCPDCRTINEKKTKVNALTCTNCEKLFCYICNKSIKDIKHY